MNMEVDLKDYKQSRLAELLRLLDPSISPLLQGISFCMVETTYRPTDTAWGIGDTLVLGGGPFANVLGAPELGHRPMGLCLNQRDMVVQRFVGRKVKSWARFQVAQVPRQVNMHAKFEWVYIFPSYDWLSWRDWVADHITKYAQVVVAQEVAKSLDSDGIIYLRQAGKTMCKLADRETADVAVWMAKEVRGEVRRLDSESSI